MNFFGIIKEIEKIDGDAMGRLEHAGRRAFMHKFSKNLSLAAAPVALASIVNKAYGQSAAEIEILNFALTLEYLEDAYYQAGNAAAGLIPAQYKTVFAQIGKHETQHVKFLEGALGAKKVAKPKFDVTAKGAFPDVLTKFDTFVFLSHALEDTGVRAYKGQAAGLMGAPALLEYALQIHAVEARHAAKVRDILSVIRGIDRIKPWISLNEGSPAPVYAGDENTVQGGVDIKGLGGKSLDAVTEAFDEPLTKAEILAIAGPFIVG